MRILALAILLLAGCAPIATPGTNAPATRPAPGDPAFFTIETGADGSAIATLPKPDENGVALRMIHSAGLTAGLGSNPVGLDRGYADSGRIIAIRRIGAKVVIEQENWRYRASAENALERQAVAQSFAPSILWAGKVKDEKPGGAFTVDIAEFLTSDILDIKGVLVAAEQPGYSLEAGRSFVEPASTLAFPDNVEIDAMLTFAGEKPGDEVAATAADGRAFTLKQHHSFVRLPDDGFKTRAFDPRAGAIDAPYYDFSAPLGEPIAKSFARRFRLERIKADDATGQVKKPIVFYVDPGAPEPIRSALVDGASWWGDAFKAAGFEDAYRVETLPDGAHPMDIRYNVIQWVHRQTRGWSYGGGVFDPRTGEMLKAHVVLGSQRVRQDRMIFEGLAGAAKTGSGASDDPIALSLARIRQLAAHEVGHTLGFAHNFAASNVGRSSVMDYPAPYVRPTADGKLDFSAAYSKGVGAWDKAAATWLYAEFPEGADEKAGLERILASARAAGLRFVDDAQARGASGAHPYASVWDNGADPVAALRETMAVRRIALSNFGLGALKPGQPTSDLRQVIVPIYLYHRYEVDAAAKLVGGYAFSYSASGDGASAGAPVAADLQRGALAALVDTLDPAALDLPDATLDLFGPPLESFNGGALGERFDGATGAMFDIVAAADAASNVTLGALLHPARIARLIESERRDAGALGYDDVLGAIEARILAPDADPRRAAIARRLAVRFVSTLIGLAIDEAATPEIVARTNFYLGELSARLSSVVIAADETEAAARRDLSRRIEAHLSRPAAPLAPQAKAKAPPPGPPIGALEACWFCETF